MLGELPGSTEAHTVKREPPPDAKEWEDKPDKANLLSPNPGTGD
jgi:ferredoxin